MAAPCVAKLQKIFRLGISQRNVKPVQADKGHATAADMVINVYSYM